MRCHFFSLHFPLNLEKHVRQTPCSTCNVVKNNTVPVCKNFCFITCPDPFRTPDLAVSVKKKKIFFSRFFCSTILVESLYVALASQCHTLRKKFRKLRTLQLIKTSFFLKNSYEFKATMLITRAGNKIVNTLKR